MKSTLFIFLAALMVLGQAQTETEKPGPLAVVKFKAGLYKEPSGLIRPVHEPDPPMNEPVGVMRPPPRNESAESRHRREIGERGADLRRGEMNASISGKKGEKTYFYHLEIRNTGTRSIKNFAWEYQSTGVPHISDRQFFCGLNAKPNDKKQFDLFSPFPPSRIVDVASAGQKDNNSKGVVVINKIEYTDGSIWVRRGWNPANFSDGVTHNIEPGICLGL
jgi:hypothetical protein